MMSEIKIAYHVLSTDYVENFMNIAAWNCSVYQWLYMWTWHFALKEIIFLSIKFAEVYD